MIQDQCRNATGILHNEDDDMSECDRYKGLLVGLVDKELTNEEMVEVNDHLTRCAACREDYENLIQSADMFKGIAFREPEAEILNQLWKTPYGWFARNAGILLIVLGYLVFILYGAYEFITGGTEALTIRLAVAAITIGFVMLLALVIVGRLKSYKTDPYKEIER